MQGVAPHSLVQDMRLITCGSHGIKFSTFVSDVLVSRVEVAGAFPPDIANISAAPGEQLPGAKRRAGQRLSCWAAGRQLPS
jgi:hypothetical protein